ncbi:hypothetical protein B4073_2298 [Bacillus subtilis]|uniref:Uncharacterized protein n=2 Tax=Bacillus subtilis TaxID=1423 RepID=A0A0C3KMK6_BACIU|nr:hypothetical protein B4067_2512 [Bacillus subtilis subsp. subtilis]KIN29704.1 hypothetical protein B4068_2326 [Bacillus subtilis]GAK79467.1 hypothetical protein BSMD_013750 [Bacillus subtilis Miyagi-4]KIN37242.1 hypothetical protein B4071_2251 [Bacillus subtilis]KIN40620.1 hypothetical protein B4070_2271 [Bacillus subtilis]
MRLFCVQFLQKSFDVLRDNKERVYKNNLVTENTITLKNLQ